MTMLSYLWLIPVLPLLAAGIGAFLKRPMRTAGGRGCHRAMSASFVLATIAFVQLLSHPQRAYINFPWMQFGAEWIKLGWVLDPLSAIMLVMVTFVALLVFIYSTAYMHHDENFTRFFCFLSLFAAAMLGLLIANSLLLLFMCWEVVGLTSYLLIGFWFERPAAAAAAKKAFITTRIGDPRSPARYGLALCANRDSCLLRSRSRMHGAGGARFAGIAGHRHWSADILRRCRQVRSITVTCLAARCHGGSNTGKRADPRCDHGRRRGLPGSAGLSPDEFAGKHRAPLRHMDRSGHRHLCRPGRGSPGTTSNASSPTPPFRNSAT